MKVFFSRKNTSEGKRRASRGFSLMEMLVVIAIIAILVGIAFLAASGLIASMRQNKLDTIAQDIYVAAQDRLTEMYTDNRADAVSYEKLEADGGSTAGMFLLKADDTLCKPKDWDSTIPYAGLNALYNKDAAAAAVLLPKGALSAEVEDNHWIVEYNPEYGYIYGVFYSEKGFAPADISSWYSSNTANKYRTFADRKGSGVGYYGGVGVLGGKVAMTNTSLNVSVNIINAEELRADISVKVPTEFKNRPVRLTLTFTGAQSGVTTDKQIVMTAMDYGYFNRSYELMMDSFNPKSGKSQQFGQLELFQGMYPGENVTVEIFAELGTQGAGAFAADASLDTARVNGVFNSLFASYDPETKTASVNAGRHLQNLDGATVDSRVDVVNVVQTANIDFKNETKDVADDEIYWWAETYYKYNENGIKEIRKFNPVTNSKITSMLGSGKDEENKTVYYIISGMTVNAESEEPAGMFGTLGRTGESILVQDVSLVGTTVRDNSKQSSVGALAGRTSGSVTLIHTGAYLSREDYNNKSYDNTEETFSALSGRIVGGLIGEAANGVVATECYSAQVLRGSVYVGGLFGSVDGKMELSRSYADCYLTADGGTVGGLVGRCSPTSTINGCYSAGFTVGVPSCSAGFTYSPVASVSDSYCVLNIGPDSTENNQVVVPTMFFTTVGYGSSATNVYYAPQEGVVYDTGRITKIGEEKSFSLLRNGKAPTFTNLSGNNFRFSSVSGDTTAYNLAAGLGLTNYPYPFIYRQDGTVLHHYGDWDGNLFDPGTLVYFEEYSDGYRGYYGAGSDFLNSAKTVVRDGYALLYTSTSVENAPNYGTEEIAIVHYNGGNYSIAPIDLATDDPYHVTKRSITGNPVDADYYFRDLPAEIVNAPSAAVGSFYTFIQVETPDTKKDENEGVSYYYFNPHFAATVEQVENLNSAKPTLSSAAKNVVRIRTPRHLYLLSRYFRDHSGAMGYKVTLEQEMNLNYGGYDWEKAGFSGAVSVQAPIGNADKPFRATYDGKYYEITGVSFESDTLYTGMFGYIGKNPDSSREYGKLRNIFLAANKEDKRFIRFKQAPHEANNYAFAGTLAGANYGSIYNCMVAGYGINLDTYNTTLYVGGLVGRNSGTITNCSAENPFVTVRTNSANGFVGAFVGLNDGSGSISNACSMSSLDVSRYSSGSVRMGGFAGGNAGSVSNSYTVCAMTASNILERDVDGFAPTGGSVQGCYFLSGGTYKFVGEVHAYGQESKTANKVVGWRNMPGAVNGISLKGFGSIPSSGSCGYNKMMADTTGAMSGKYPFASPVRIGSSGTNYVYYGDWITNDVFGDYGILYWEHEEHGTNDGYHFYLRDCDGNYFTTLCTAHDDGGVITEYGYGYYRLKDVQDKVSVPEFHNVPENLEPYINTRAQDDISSQFADSYEFVLYNTSDAFANTPDGMYVTGQNAYAWAEFSLAEPDDSKFLHFSFSPFFGAAVQAAELKNEQDAPEPPTTMEIRSIEQLQFLNWNRGAGTETEPVEANTKQLVDKSNYMRFTYLGQTNLPDITGQQVKDNALNKDVFNWVWNQTHDIKLDTSIQTGFTPIAAAGTSSDNSAYNATLYAWFGSTYDGHSYKIEDITITSDAYTVGLFGVTAGAHMMNIIMYSENNARIVRSAPYGNNTLGAYSIGGLIGVAYDYADSSDNHAIENCAIAGYKIIDNSKNQQGRGEANVGGLVGVSNGDLKRCSAVTDIQINCTHRQGDYGYTQASFGNFIRVGGLTGATLGTVSNCYTGGRITVDKETLKENVKSSGYNSRDGFATEGQISVIGESQHTSTSVYLSGIGGSGFAQNYQNFSGYDNFREGAPTYRNCYTYMEFPKLTGTIRSICAIGGLADRYYYGKGVTIDNCYYLEEYLKPSRILPGDNDQDKPKFYYNDRVTDVIGTLKKKLNGTEMYYYYEMINGTSVCENKLIKNTDIDSKASGTPTSATLAEMTKLENLPSGIWRRVTTVENGATVNGKYSFPGSDHQLDGRNYPFLATVTQDDCTIFVHYGRWPKGEGLFSSVSNITLDLLVENEDSLDVTLTNYKNYRIDEITNLDAVTFTYSELQEDGTVAKDLETSSIVQVTPELNSDGTVKMSILGLKEGTTTITAEYGGNEANIQVTVTAEFSINVEPVTVTLENGVVTQVAPVEDPTMIPEAFQQDDLYWKLSGVNSKGTPLELTAENPENWRVEDNTVDENYDEYQFLTAATGEVLLRFRSNDVKLHNVQVTAYNVVGVNSQQVTGTRSREISFEIVKNPPTVTVFAYPQGTEGNRIVATLYQIEEENGGLRYCVSKTLGDPVTKLDAPAETPLGYDQFRGYFLTANGEEEPTAFAQLSEDGSYGIVYWDPIENENNGLTVYGSWTVAQFQAAFKPGYESVTVVGVEQDAETSLYTLPYTMNDGITIPNVDPTEFVDEKQGRTAVFSGWKVAEADASGNWIIGERFDAGQMLESGRCGNVTFEAVWSSRYQIQYFMEDGITVYEGVDTKYTSYVGEASNIQLFTPEGTEDGDRIFIGWKLLQTEQPEGVTGWTPGVLYKNPVTGISCTGNIQLVAQWGKSYTISYKNGEADFLTQQYAEGGEYQFPAGPTAPEGYRFDCWKVTDVAEDAEGWALEKTYAAGEKLDNTQAVYKGDVTLSAQWRKATYTISFVLEGGITSEGKDTIDPIVYELGSTITMPHDLTKEETSGFEWVVSYAEFNTDPNCFWKEEHSFKPTDVLTADEFFYGNVTLTARWTVKTYTIFYYPDGGRMSFDDIDGKYMQQFTKVGGLTFADAVKPGYTLTGWVQDKNLSENTFFGTTPYAPGQKVLDPVGDVHMTAQWEVKEYTIRFHYADAKPGTDPIFTQTYTVESTEPLHALPTPTGYDVTGWKTGDTVDDEGNWTANTDYAVGTVLTGMYGDVDLYCTRNAKRYNITYMNGEKPVESGTYTIEDEVIIRGAPVANAKDGKAQFFTGWTAAPEEASNGWTSGGTYNPGDKVGPGAYGDVTLTAGFEFRTLTLSASSAGSNKEKQYHVEYGYNGKSFEDYFYESYEAPSRKGWTLTGWYTAKGGTGQKVLDAEGKIVTNDDGTKVSIPGFITDGMLNLEEDQTLYARWTRHVNAFIRVDYPTDGKAVMIGSEDENGLHLLTSQKKVSYWTSYKIGVKTIPSAESGYFYSDKNYDKNTMDWSFSGNTSAAMIKAPNSDDGYLGRTYSLGMIDGNLVLVWSLAVQQGTDNNWVVQRVNDMEYTLSFTYSHYVDDTVDTLFLNLSEGNAKISSNPQAISFYRIESVEEESYD